MKMSTRISITLPCNRVSITVQLRYVKLRCRLVHDFNNFGLYFVCILHDFNNFRLHGYFLQILNLCSNASSNLQQKIKLCRIIDLCECFFNRWFFIDRFFIARFFIDRFFIVRFFLQILSWIIR